MALDLSGRPYFVWDGRFNRERSATCRPSWCRISSAPCATPWAPRCTCGERREHAPHGRILLQGRRPGACARPFAATAASCRAPRAPCERSATSSSSPAAARTSPRFSSRSSGSSVRAELSADPHRIRGASHVILPGVGAAPDAMARLRSSGLDTLIPSLTQPVLGICLGMQLLHESSERRAHPLPGHDPGGDRAARATRPAVPFPTWAGTRSTSSRHSPLLEGLGDARACLLRAQLRGAAGRYAPSRSCRYGAAFSACVAWRNFYGVQFHPERSAAAGARVLRNFIGLH